MKIIQTTAVVDAAHHLVVQMPPDVATGQHQVVIVIEEFPRPVPKKDWFKDWPVIDVGPWPKNLSLRREDLYGDNGR